MTCNLLVITFLATFSTSIFADQHKTTTSLRPKRKAHSHEHGNSEFKLIATGNELILEGALPMDDVFGFERAPKNDAERAALKNALNLIETGKLLAPDNVDCKISEAKAEIDPQFDRKVTHYEVDISLSWKCPKPVTQLRLDGFASFKSINSLTLVLLNQGKQTSISVKRSDQKSVVSLIEK